MNVMNSCTVKFACSQGGQCIQRQSRFMQLCINRRDKLDSQICLAKAAASCFRLQLSASQQMYRHMQMSNSSCCVFSFDTMSLQVSSSLGRLAEG